MVASGLMGYDECQLRDVQSVIMKMHIADTTEKKIWIGKSALFVSKEFENSMHLAIDIMHNCD